MKPLIILGAGGFAREAAAWVNQSQGTEYKLIGFYDEFSDNHKTILDLPVLNDLRSFARADFIVGVGDPKLKQKFMAQARTAGMNACKPIIHQSCILGDHVSMGYGSILCPNVTITCNVYIGPGVIINIGSTVGHDSEVLDYTTISPGANISGNVKIGHLSYIGTNACIREGVKIGCEAVVGMGAVVLKDVETKDTVIGNPARSRPVLVPNDNLVALHTPGSGA